MFLGDKRELDAGLLFCLLFKTQLPQPVCFFFFLSCFVFIIGELKPFTFKGITERCLLISLILWLFIWLIGLLLVLHPLPSTVRGFQAYFLGCWVPPYPPLFSLALMKVILPCTLRSGDCLSSPCVEYSSEYLLAQ